MRIERADINHVVQNSHATVHLTTASTGPFEHGSHIFPDRPASNRVEGCHAAAWLGEIHDRIGYYRRGLNSFRSRDLIDPNRPQASDIRGIDLLQKGIPLRMVVARISEPVARFGICPAETIVGNLRAQR